MPLYQTPSQKAEAERDALREAASAELRVKHQQVLELEDQIEEWRSLQQFDRARYALAESLLHDLSQAVVDWWPNSDPPAAINTHLRAVREAYPHMAKPR